MRTRVSRILLSGILALAALSFGLTGCDEGADDAQTADQLYAEGMVYIEESMQDINPETAPWEWAVDMSEANGMFEDALSEDPDHCGALLMSALTRLMMVAQDEELASIMEALFPEVESRGDPLAGHLLRWFSRPDVYALRDRLKDARQDAFDFSELQVFIEDEVNPAMEYADDRLSRFEQLGCTVPLSFDIEEERTTIEMELDVSDALFVHAALDAVQAVFHVAVSYNVDVEAGQSLQDLIETDPDFLSLRPGEHMGSAHAELLEMEEHLRDACVSVQSETDDQSDDLITDSYDVGWLPLGEGTVDELMEVADGIGEALTTGVIFNPYLDTGEPGAPDIDITVDLQEMFTDPIDPITDYLPAHTWPSADSINIVRPIDFPDPSFSDITPGMSDADWELLISWLEGE